VASEIKSRFEFNAQGGADAGHSINARLLGKRILEKNEKNFAACARNKWQAAASSRGNLGSVAEIRQSGAKRKFA